MTESTEKRTAEALRGKAIDLRDQVDGWVRKASDATGVGEKALKAGLLFTAGLVLGLMIRRRSDR